MKNLLTLLLLVLGTAAFANTGKNTDPKPGIENHEESSCKKTACKPAKAQETATAATKPAQRQKETQRAGTTKTCTTAEKSTFGISGYFVDLVHNSNVKIVKMLID